MFLGPLRLFHDVIRAGSVRAASDALGISASSITRQIQQLEHQMGAVLLERSSTGVVPTHAGKMVAQFAQAVVLEFDTLRADINERGSLKGHIRVAVVESMVSKVVQAMAALKARFADVSFSLSMLPAKRVVESVKASEADVGVSFCVSLDPDLSVITRYPEPVVLAVSPRHPWAAIGAIPVQALQGVPVGVPETSFGVRALLDEQTRSLGFVLAPGLVTNSFEALRTYARTGAVSVLPRASFDSDRIAGVLKSVSLESEALNSTTADAVILRHRRSSRLLKLFYGELERVQ